VPQSPGLLAELAGFAGPTAVLAHLSQSLRNVGSVPDTGDAVAAAQQFLGPAEVRRPAAPRQVAVRPADPAPARIGVQPRPEQLLGFVGHAGVEVGSGATRCIGEDFGLAEAILILATTAAVAPQRMKPLS
jgi:hypothetical protein